MPSYFAALAHAPAAEANLINYMWPLLVVLFSAFLPGLRLYPRHIAGAATGTAGCAILLGGNASLSWAYLPGYAAAAGSAIIWAAYSVLARRLAAVPTGAVAGFCAATSVLATLAHLATERTVAPDPASLLAALGDGRRPGRRRLLPVGYRHETRRPTPARQLAYITPVASTLLLCAAGFAPLTWPTLAAAALVAAGGLIAAPAEAPARVPARRRQLRTRRN